jgi:heat shock protein 90kDa beta
LQLEKVVEDDSPADENTDEALVEDVKEEKEGADPSPKMKTVVVEEWAHLNAQPPLWQRWVLRVAQNIQVSNVFNRDPKDISHLEYNLFYQATFKDFKDPLAYHHFSGDADGVAFKGIIYIPAQLYVPFPLCYVRISNLRQVTTTSGTTSKRSPRMMLG